ncbi:MAG: glutamine-hydrolyzing GMP synthase [Oscillospiraceae bacterium]|nr:glutamine-hydrolyzing GMP synthase [Oscillospiraceae bacterium]
MSQMFSNKHELILVVDFGGQYNQLIARRIREQHIYCEVISYRTSVAEIVARKPKGIIFTGGPDSVYLKNSPKIDKEIFSLGIPILGICYGAQLMAHVLGGEIAAAKDSSLAEFGKTVTHIDTHSVLFRGMSDTTIAWMSHNDYIKRLPEGFIAIAHTAKCRYAAIEDRERHLYGVQFHPEVNHTVQGSELLKNFLRSICGCHADWTMESYAESAVKEIREKVGDGRVLLALSGGVDSSVACMLLAKAVGEQLTCIFVDHGLMRKNEGDEVENAFADSGVNFIRINAAERFMKALAGISDPEKKRKIIGMEFIRVFETEAQKLGRIDYLVQGTIYPDVIESGAGDAAVIKSHHNVGGLPDFVDFKEIIEPLRLLFKDEVRKLGLTLGLAEELVWRQPFPGPGLAVRIIGNITAEKVRILQEADAIFREEIVNAGLSRSINQYFAVLTDMRSVGVMGDGRSYDHTLALRGVTTSDFMTADFARIPYDVLEKVSVRIVNEVGGINRIVYDITSKPPSTIEWE